MTKTRRQIEADLKNVDIVVEIIDARIPVSSRNPDIDAICAGKPRLIVLNRAEQADPTLNRRWAASLKAQGHAVLEDQLPFCTSAHLWQPRAMLLDALVDNGILTVPADPDRSTVAMALYLT